MAIVYDWYENPPNKPESIFPRHENGETCHRQHPAAQDCSGI
mgnify:FL=1